jgi:hypothetical protein
MIIHHKDCGWWIIVMRFKVLLILQHLFWEILVEAVLGVHAGSIKIKKYLYPDSVTMHLLHKGFIEDYMCWYAHEKLFFRNESMVERMVGSTSSASNVHGVINNNSNPYRNMVIDTMRMNQGNVSQCSIVKD